MILKFVLLIIIGASNCISEHLENISKTGPHEVFPSNIEYCEDFKHTVNIKNNLKLNEKNVISKVFEDFPVLVQYNETLEQYNFAPKQFLFGNKTELLLSAVFERIFEKLTDIKNTKLNEVVLTLSKEKPFNYEYFLLNAFDVIYTRNNRKAEVEKIFKITNRDENTSTFVENKNYYDYENVDNLSQKKLKRHAKYLICAFLTLANITNSYYSIKELLQPLEVIIRDDKSSSAIIIFINKFLTKAMEGNGDAVNIYRNLLMAYVISQLQTVDAFNISELLSLQNKNDLQIRNDFKKFKELNPEGILTLALEWRFKTEDALVKSNISEYFHVMDEIFREILESRNAETIVNYRSLSDDMSTRKMLIFDIKKNLGHVNRKGARVKKVLNHIKTVTADPQTSTSLLQFAKEFLKHFNSSQLNLMPTVYNYMARELSTIEPLDASIFNKIREKKMEELAPIVNEHITKDPGSIITMAFDWLFDLKIQILTRSKKNSLFNILKSTLEQAKKRREERLKKVHHTSKKRTKIVIDTLDLDKSDEIILHKAGNY